MPPMWPVSSRRDILTLRQAQVRSFRVDLYYLKVTKLIRKSNEINSDWLPCETRLLLLIGISSSSSASSANLVPSRLVYSEKSICTNGPFFAFVFLIELTNINLFKNAFGSATRKYESDPNHFSRKVIPRIASSRWPNLIRLDLFYIFAYFLFLCERQQFLAKKTASRLAWGDDEKNLSFSIWLRGPLKKKKRWNCYLLVLQFIGTRRKRKEKRVKRKKKRVHGRKLPITKARLEVSGEG